MPAWQVHGTPIDARVMPLLRAVARTGSLNRAVASLRMSYRHAWGLLGKTERALGQPLVALSRGRGANITELAQKILDADDAASRLLEEGLADRLVALRGLHPHATPGNPRQQLLVHASHDLALAEMRDLLSGAPGAFELQFRGSLDSLADLAQGRCNIAGFHVPAAPADERAFDEYRPLLRARSLRLIEFATRRQGLMIAPGNPRGIRSLVDLADGRTRFINRQSGSGTRLYLDRLLAAHRLPAARILGYQKEEFTHAAVAATVASGMADAGFGIEAAARQQGLDFVAIGVERYFLAARLATLASAAARALLDYLGGPGFRKLLAGLPGYGEPATAGAQLARDALAGRPLTRAGLTG